MLNELIFGRLLAKIGAAPSSPHGADTDHHSAEDWRAYFHALEHKTAFERRLRR